MPERVVVLVTGAGGGSLGHELIQTLRLAATPYRIVASDTSPDSLGLYDADVGRVVPPASDPSYLDALLELCRRHSVAVVIPGSEAELQVLSAARGQLSERGVLLLANTTDVIDLCSDKGATSQALANLGIKVPRTVVAATEAAADEVDWYPCIVKAARGASGSSQVHLARDPEELRFFVRYVRLAGFLPIIQEYVGRPEQEYTVGVLHGFDGGRLGSLAMRRTLRGLSVKLRLPSPDGAQSLALSSGISQGTIEHVPALQEACERMAQSLGSRGPLNIQLRLVDGQAVPFEINPRFSGTCCLRALAGFNEPDLLIRRELLGEASPVSEYRTGLAIRGLANRFIPPSGRTA